MCSWAISAVLIYNRSEKLVYSCGMDLLRAFDLCSWKKNIPLIDREICPLILRCHTLIKHVSTVRWGSTISISFQVINGGRKVQFCQQSCFEFKFINF